MGYYHCTSCDNYFVTEYHVNPDCCPQCNDIHHLKSIQRQEYFEWVDAIYYTKRYSEMREEDRHNAFYDYAKVIWNGYNSKHRGR